MLSGSGRIELVGASYAACFCLIVHCCMAKDCVSSCGNIHNISHPFRLKTDPKHCGVEVFELACIAHTLIWYGNASGGEVGYRVQAINYNNSTIRLTDPNVFMDDCTLRVVSSSNTYGDSIYLKRFINQSYGFFHRFDFITYSYEYRCQEMILRSCPFPQTGKLDGFNSSCNEIVVNNSDSASYAKRYWHVNVGNMNANSLENACRIEYRSWTSLLPEGANNISYKDLNNSFAYGFELFWVLDNEKRLWILSILPILQILLLGYFVIYKGLLCCCGTPCVTAFLIYKWRRRHLSAYDNIEIYLNCNQNSLMPIRYSYSQIKKMTKGFKEKLGQGGYGSVYKGKLRCGNFAAIKMLDKSKANGEDFINEVGTIGRIHHTNVVQLIGFCVEGSKYALVYEFMVNGSLDKYVLSKQDCIPINNEKIYDICLGVARGIEYLYRGCNMQILHFDIKPHNILLDENFIPKISDFGLAKLCSTDNSIVSLSVARGTIGYMARELFYRNIGRISYKADVYSFRMLLMEVLEKRKNLNPLTEHSSQIYFHHGFMTKLVQKRILREKMARRRK